MSETPKEAALLPVRSNAGLGDACIMSMPSFDVRLGMLDCGKPAKWVDQNTGKKYCGTHRRSVDMVLRNQGKPLCVALPNVV